MNDSYNPDADLQLQQHNLLFLLLLFVWLTNSIIEGCLFEKNEN